MTTNWWPGLIALGVGALLSAVALLVLGRKGERSKDNAWKPLDAKARGLVEQLKELEADKHHYDAETLAREKMRLEQEAAAAMRARDAVKAGGPVPSPAREPHASVGFFKKRPMLTGALWGSGFTAFIAAAIFMVALSPETGAKRDPGSVSSTNDPRYEAVLVLSAISISFGDSEQLLQAWDIYMRQQPPRRRPPQLQRAFEWLEKVTNEKGE
jgi:hypothetical protein